MAAYVKVTIKEFLAMREVIESADAAAGNYDDDQQAEISKAVKATLAIEKRNRVEPPSHRPGNQK